MYRFYLHALLGSRSSGSGRGDGPLHLHQQHEQPSDSLKNLTDSAARNGKESIAHEIVVLRFADGVLHRCYQSLATRRERGPATARLQRLRERLALLAPDRVARIVGLGISRLLVTELMRKQRWDESIRELNAAIYQSPLNSSRPVNGLSEALVLLAEAYAGAERFDEGIHSLCLSIDFAADQCEIDESPEISLGGPPVSNVDGAFEHYNYMSGTSAPGPHLSPGCSMVFGLYAMACWTHARGLREDAVQWFDRAMQSAQKHCASNMTLMSGLNDTLSAAISALSSNQHDVPIISMDDAAISRYYKWKQAFLAARAPLHFLDARPITPARTPALRAPPNSTYSPNVKRLRPFSPVSREDHPGEEVGNVKAGRGAVGSREAWVSSSPVRPLQLTDSAIVDRPKEPEVHRLQLVDSDTAAYIVARSFDTPIETIVQFLRMSIDRLYYEISMTADLVKSFEPQQQAARAAFFARHCGSCRSVRIAAAQRRHRLMISATSGDINPQRGSNNKRAPKNDVTREGDEDDLKIAVSVSAVRFRDEAELAMHYAADRFKAAAMQGQVKEIYAENETDMSLVRRSRFAGIENRERAALMIQTAARRFFSEQLVSVLIDAKQERIQYEYRFAEAKHQMKALFNDFLTVLRIQKDGMQGSLRSIGSKELAENPYLIECLKRLTDMSSRISTEAILGGDRGFEYYENIPDTMASRIQCAFRRNRLEHRLMRRLAAKKRLAASDVATSTEEVLLSDRGTEAMYPYDVCDVETQCDDGNLSLTGDPASNSIESLEDTMVERSVQVGIDMSDAACQYEVVAKEPVIPIVESVDVTVQTTDVVRIHAESQTVTDDNGRAAIYAVEHISGNVALGGVFAALEECGAIQLQRKEELARQTAEAEAYNADEDFVVLDDASEPSIHNNCAEEGAASPTPAINPSILLAIAEAANLAAAVSADAESRGVVSTEEVTSLCAAANQCCPHFVGDIAPQESKNLGIAFTQAWDYYIALAMTRLHVLLAIEAEAVHCGATLVHSLLGTEPESMPDAPPSPFKGVTWRSKSVDMPRIKSVRSIAAAEGVGAPAEVVAECVQEAWALLRQEASVRVSIVRALVDCAPKCSEEADAKSIRLFAQLQALDLCSRLRRASQDIFDGLREAHCGRRAMEWSGHVHSASLAFRDMCLQLATLVASLRDAGLQEGGGEQEATYLARGDVADAVTSIGRAVDLACEKLLQADVFSTVGPASGGGEGSRSKAAARFVEALSLDDNEEEGDVESKPRDYHREMLLRSAATMVQDAASEACAEVFAKASALVASSPSAPSVSLSALGGPVSEDLQRFSVSLGQRLCKDVETRAPLLVMLR